MMFWTIISIVIILHILKSANKSNEVRLSRINHTRISKMEKAELERNAQKLLNMIERRK